MSDIFRLKAKVKEGKHWRGTINVSYEGETMELAIRQLRDPELEMVLRKIDQSELEELKGSLPEEESQEYRELMEKDELDDDEAARLTELQDMLDDDDLNIFDALSTETFEAFRDVARYCVVPDDEDIAQAFQDHTFISYVEEEYGIKVRTPDDIYDKEEDEGPLKDVIVKTIEDMQNFGSFSVGMHALKETVGDEKN